jgi:hypothetical protein
MMENRDGESGRTNNEKFRDEVLRLCADLGPIGVGKIEIGLHNLLEYFGKRFSIKRRETTEARGCQGW